MYKMGPHKVGHERGGTKMPRWRMSLAAHGQIRLDSRKKNEKVMDPWGQKNVGWINKTKDFEQKCHDALCPWLHVDIFDWGQERNVRWINKKIDPT